MGPPLKNNLQELYKIVNDSIESGENAFIKIKKDKKGKRVWRLSPLGKDSDPNEGLFASLQQRSIVDVIEFVNNKTEFFRSFDSVLPRSTKGEKDSKLIGAVVLANAIRVGTRKMASMSDLKESALLSAEASYIRLESLLLAIDKINNAVAKFPIYKERHIMSILHGSLDGLKLETSFKNIMARHSSKFFADGTGGALFGRV